MRGRINSRKESSLRKRSNYQIGSKMEGTDFSWKMNRNGRSASSYTWKCGITRSMVLRCSDISCSGNNRRINSNGIRDSWCSIAWGSWWRTDRSIWTMASSHVVTTLKAHKILLLFTSLLLFTQLSFYLVSSAWWIAFRSGQGSAAVIQTNLQTIIRYNETAMIIFFFSWVVEWKLGKCCSILSCRTSHLLSSSSLAWLRP